MTERIEEAYLKVKEKMEVRAPAEKVAEAYSAYLKELPLRSRNIVIATLTFRKGVMNYIPRRLVPVLLKTPEFYERYAALTSYSEEVEKRFQEALESDITINRLEGKPLVRRIRGRILVTTPSFEPNTHWGSSWIRNETIPMARMAGSTRELFRILDNRTIFAAEAIAGNFICGIGHGGPNVYTGQFMRILWDVGEYDKREAEGKMIKLLSCFIGQKLGPDLIEKGAVGFQGYVEEYAFTFQPRFYLYPVLDKAAEKFLETYTDGCNLLTRGGTNKAAYQLEKERLILNAAIEPDPETRAFLLHDASALIMLGDPDAEILGD